LVRKGIGRFPVSQLARTHSVRLDGVSELREEFSVDLPLFHQPRFGMIYVAEGKAGHVEALVERGVLISDGNLYEDGIFVGVRKAIE